MYPHAQTMRLQATSACTSSSNLMFHFTPLASKILIFGFVPVVSSLKNLKGGFGLPSSLPIPRSRFNFEMSPRLCQIAGAPDLVGATATFFVLFPSPDPLLFFCAATLPFANDRVKAPATAKQIRSAKAPGRDEVRRDTCERNIILPP